MDILPWRRSPFFVVCLGLHVYLQCMESATGNSNERKELDILKALNISATTRGMHQRNASWEFTKGVSFSPLPLSSTNELFSSLSQNLNFRISAMQVESNVASLIYVKSEVDGRTYLQVVSNLVHKFLVVKYCSENCKRFHSIKFPQTLGSDRFSTIEILLRSRNVTLVVNCNQVHSRKLSSTIPWDLFSRSSVTFGMDKYGKRKFRGIIAEAGLFNYRSQSPFCKKMKSRAPKTEHATINKTDDFAANDQPIEYTFTTGDLPAWDFTRKDDLDVTNVIDSRNNKDILSSLQEEIRTMADMINMLKSQNAQLESRVSHLETCECIPQCSHEGKIFQEGETWSRDSCTDCSCQGGQPVCTVRTDIPECYDPCIERPCQNGGTCNGSPGYRNYTCVCPPTCTGSECERRVNPCVYEKHAGDTCDAADPSQRFFYDIRTQSCQPFLFEGCNGNPNNFETISQCEGTCLVGACSYRTISVSGASSYHCEIFNMATCRSLAKTEGQEVICFRPDQTCEEDTCRPVEEGCRYGDNTYKVNESFRVGCDTCRCSSNQQVLCSCSRMRVRKEIRDMTHGELIRFQNAIQKLRREPREDVWTEYRDMYMRYIMQSNSMPLFLPWHRMFLYRMEQKLQDIDCSITIPYYDFTTDVGNFSNAIIWQPNYLGGNGDANGCVPDHPFGPSGLWNPCITRRFDRTVRIPNAVEISVAMSSETFEEFSQSLQAIAAYIHSFVGGNMAVASSPYDPLFYLIHGYLDMLYSRWQAIDNGRNKGKFPREVAEVVMMPFNVQAGSVIDLSALCVMYVLPSDGTPCNRTTSAFGRDGYDVYGYNRWGYNRHGYDRYGYNVRGYDAAGRVDMRNIYRHSGYDNYGYDRSGYDRRGYDRYGYDRQGYNRDGYNLQGYDRDGYDRYGFNIHGFNIMGVDRQGKDRRGNIVVSEGFDGKCLDPNALTSDVITQFQYVLEPRSQPTCNYSYQRPISPWQSRIIMEVLHHQPRVFLQTLPRTCVGLGMVPTSWYKQFWINRRDNIQMGINVEITPNQPITSQRFCFDAAPILHTCGCDYNQQVETCTSNPCETANCAAFPFATCVIDFCGDCMPRWYHQGRLVDCTPVITDPCHPNPCQNGGTCRSSEWPNQPDLITCACPPGFEGPRCEWEASQVCALPRDSGSCNKRSQRWYFNLRTQSCDVFTYNGCAGNANNFESLVACQHRCVSGTCCTRSPRNLSVLYGYNQEGFDRYGFDRDGQGQGGRMRTVDTGTRYGAAIFNEQGLDWQGYNSQGFNALGDDQQGYDQQGFRDGWNRTGWSQIGEYDGIVDYNQQGYDINTGYDRAGFNCHGYNEDSLDYRGLASGFRYDCFDVTSLQECKEMENSQTQLQVVSFIPGTNCGEVNCTESCGCQFQGKSYRFGQKFEGDCNSFTCSLDGHIEFDCRGAKTRKEIRELSESELERYQNAIKQLASGMNSRWNQLAELHSRHIPQAYGSAAFLPWHRYYLTMVERELQTIDCALTIPYYDWTADVGDFTGSYIWQANVFGGNGDSNTECVRHHPFKNQDPPHWSPCLRRKLDVNVRLPDLVNVELLLTEPSYDKFRLRLETMSSLFHLAVGGHMATTYSPYDPLFLSHYAYIDKLWDEWQRRHPDGVFQYPPSLRYVPLAPFGVSPDDMFSSEDQLCVKYIPITEGAECNTTKPDVGYDFSGFDRHGFNREGFDRDGYNRKGYNHQGEFDNRGIYDNNGFDKRGYGRNGFDRSGFDQYGYDQEGFDRDGYNFRGFDRSGYNRQGFDMEGNTPFGFNKNGRFLPSVDQTKLYQFDQYGYNIYGFNKYGYNRQGFDVYGFNSQGYNSDNCNRYYNGPLYLKIKSWVENRLSKVNITSLEDIKRICPQVSSLQSWWYDVFWLDRGNQKALIEQVVVDWLSRRTIDTNHQPRVTSVTQDSLWLPIGPDARLCIVTHFTSGCPVDKPPVTCDQSPCSGQMCAGHSTAVCHVRGCGTCEMVWIDGITGQPLQCLGCVDPFTFAKYEEGTSWAGSSTCEICQCVRGNIECGPQQCPQLTCNHPVTLPGQCCGGCDGCGYLGRPYLNGAKFTPPDNPCQKCECINGDVTCQRDQCPLMELCLSPITLPGNCCPTCLDCGDKAHGTTWREDACRTCRCEKGQTTCEEKKCPSVSCSHPFIQPGVCCAECSDCLFEGKPYRHGQRFEPDDCRTCRCGYGSVQCREERCPPVACSDPVKVPGQCCPECPGGCMYEGRKFKDNQVFTPLFNQCLNCSCAQSIVRCVSKRCPEMQFKCEQPIVPEGECCPTHCPRCSYNGKQYEHGDEWSPEECTVCRCVEGAVSCQPKEVCSVTCTHGIQLPGQCCQQCTDCMEDNNVITDGSRFLRRGGSTCEECFCNQGNIRCRSMNIRCRPLRCTVTELKEDECCPICKGCVDDRGVQHLHDTEWKHLTDSCSTCTCQEGRITCERDPCPALSCPHSTTPPGECCAVCTHCDYNGGMYDQGQTFIDPDNPCLRCTCRNGRTTCDRLDRQCRPACPHPFQPADQCCAVCDGCSYDGQSFTNGEVFYPRQDQPCYECTCRNGRVKCGRKQCPQVPCSNPIFPPGQCCRECPPGCSIGGRIYAEGESWQDPRDACSQCSCQDLAVKCEKRACPALDCTHPAQLSGACCPTCDSCIYQGRRYRHGHRFTDSSDQCAQCVCKAGSVTCTTSECKAIPNCQSVHHPDGACCPQCLDRPCMYNGREIDDGATFTEDCKECRCNRGRMECTRITCPAIDCRQPLQGWCCGSCDGCTFVNKNFTNGQSFLHPGDPCQECSCDAGNVECKKKQESCPEARCRHPWTPPGSCCPACGGGCFYEGRTYKNFQEFSDRTDPCRKCICQHGTVECGPRPCPILECAHPVKGQCCEECTDCFYGTRRYGNGQTFPDPDNECNSCRCLNGDVKCTPDTCPPVSCSSPIRQGCCDVCPDPCSFKGREYQDGQTVSDPQACKECVCKAGNMVCLPITCPQVSCTHPYTEGCCPVCDRCFYLNRAFPSGLEFRDPSDPCSDCTCKDGNLMCRRRQCPVLRCTNLKEGQCCPVCDDRDCDYDGRSYRDGQHFTDTRDECRDCVCLRGLVTCEESDCPVTTCQHPRRSACCKTCDGCTYLGVNFVDGQTLPSHVDRCQQCTCVQGTVSCVPVPCGDTSCLHPATPGGACCPVCGDCSYASRTFRNGQEFTDIKDRCQTCRCRDGTVTCQKNCPAVPCLHPVQGECCPECTGCFYSNQRYDHGLTFDSPTNDCEECTCRLGTVECRRRACPQIACIRSVTPKGQCCPECRDECLYNGRRYNSGDSFLDYDLCRKCECRDDIANCHPIQCPTVHCRHPYIDNCCPMCSDCKYEDKDYKNGDVFQDSRDPCNECTCKDGSVTCEPRTCPEANCLNPVRGQCCPQCDGDCFYRGREYSDLAIFPDPVDPNCRVCTCQRSDVQCDTKACQPISCPHPVPGDCDCPVCDGCFYKSYKYSNGERFSHNDDRCLSCQCVNGEVTCQRPQCPRSCTHPSDSDQCCPSCTDCELDGIGFKHNQRFKKPGVPCEDCVCQGGNITCTREECPMLTCHVITTIEGVCCPTCAVCDFNGREYDHEETFTHPDDTCQSCQCTNGEVTCQDAVCEAPECSHPSPGQCCPECVDCMFESKLVGHGQRFQPDDCRDCSCSLGNVECRNQTCPRLNCQLKVKVPGECCEKCRGCVYEGQAHNSGTSWTSPSNPCMSCQCLGGIVTCSGVSCIAPCAKPIPVPGQCCPMCPSCDYNGVNYQEGEVFTPNGDPCDSCVCHDGNLECVRTPCPSLVDCPAEQIVSPLPGECCPSCGGFSTNCTLDRLGMILKPRNDPCFTCECMEDNWLCIQEFCQPLRCSAAEQIKLDGECCSRCTVCHVDTDGKTRQNGEEWQDIDNPCTTCSCSYGAVRCDTTTCDVIDCPEGSELSSPPGQCCPLCVESRRNVTCTYEGKVYSADEEWVVDECTKCKCSDGVADCHTERCPSLDCKADETPNLDPGICCPRCIPKPATCVVYGDPHYRTFDGHTVTVQGTCRYLMSTDCEGGDFTIEVHHDNRGLVGGIAWAQNLTLKVGGIQIDLLFGSKVKVNGRSVQLPFLHQPIVHVEKQGSTLLVNTNVGVKVVWDGNGYGEISVPGSYKKKMCGLCGNFNDFPQDDLRLRSGQITTSAAIFGNSWKVDGQGACDDATDFDPCIQAGYHVRKLSNTKCSVLKGSTFSRCHRVISPEPYFASCVYDLCACTDRASCLCDVLSSYAVACAQAGVPLQWRTPGLCAMSCPENRGFIFDECGPPCPRTCANKDAVLGSISAMCLKPCVASCQCPANKVQHGGWCIDPDDCP